MTRLVATRYLARLAAIVLGWATGILATQDVQFVALMRERALVALALLVGMWALHVATGYADSGVLPPTPPTEATKP